MITMNLDEKIELLRHGCIFSFDGRAVRCGEYQPNGFSFSQNLNEMSDGDIAKLGDRILSNYASSERENQKLRDLIIQEMRLGTTATLEDPVHVSYNLYHEDYVIACSVHENGVHIAIAGKAVHCWG